MYDGFVRSIAQTWLLLLLGPALAIVLSNVLLHRSAWYSWMLRQQIPGSIFAAEGESYRAWQEGVHLDRVLIGNSLALRNIDEERLDEAMGGRTLNLGINGIDLASVAMMVPDVIALRPAVVVLTVGPFELNDSLLPAFRRYYHPAVAMELYGTDVRYAPSEHLNGLALWSSRLYRHQPGLKAVALILLGQRHPIRQHPRDEPALSSTEMRLRLRQRRIELNEVRLTGVGHNVDAIQVIHRRLTAADIPLVVMPMPAHPELVEGGYHVVVLDVLTALQAELNFSLIPPHRMEGIEAADFQDPLHLAGPGQIKITAILAESLAP